MKLFGLACEGVTDYITIQNILCGYFENLDDEEIEQKQPALDETDQKQVGHGGWTNLLAYLCTTRFRDDVLNYKFLVIHIDTDVSNEIGFDVHQDAPQVDANNKILTPEDLIENVTTKLIETIEIGEIGFYQNHLDKIVFCISVHSLECWIYAFHNKKKLSQPKITGCFKALNHLLPGIKKNYRCYDQLSQPFLKRKNIDSVAEKDPSFRAFVKLLEKIEI